MNKLYFVAAHGTDGPMNVADCDTTGNNNEIFLEAARAAGFEIRDINNGKDLGKGGRIIYLCV